MINQTNLGWSEYSGNGLFNQLEYEYTIFKVNGYSIMTAVFHQTMPRQSPDFQGLTGRFAHFSFNKI